MTDPQQEHPVVHDVPDAARPPSSDPVDLDAIDDDLRDVETALGRLADGTYWIDEVTGEEIPEQVMVRNPIARRA